MELLLLLVLPLALLPLLAGDDDDDGGEEEARRTVEGGDGDDAITDETGADLLVLAGAGDDTVLLGDGDDRVFAGEGGDEVRSGGGDDEVFLAGGADVWIDSVPGDDPDAPDELDPEGDDLVRGGDGNDTLIAAGGSDDLRGDLGRDLLSGLEVQLGDPVGEDLRGTPDTLNGGFGADVLLGDDGDSLTGGGQGDAFVIARPTGPGEEIVVVEDATPGEDEVWLDADEGATGPIVLRQEADGVVVGTGGTDMALLAGRTIEEVGDGRLRIELLTTEAQFDAIVNGVGARPL
ncbi:MAG: calcium-binding protein [Hasllibacter sp.]